MTINIRVYKSHDFVFKLCVFLVFKNKTDIINQYKMIRNKMMKFMSNILS